MRSHHPDYPPASIATVALASLLTLSGIVGVSVGLPEIGFVPELWLPSLPTAVPILVLGALNLVAGVQLRALRSRAIVALALAVVARTVFMALEPFGWWSAGQSLLVVLSLAHGYRLYRAGKLYGAAPNNSSKPTPLRGAA